MLNTSTIKQLEGIKSALVLSNKMLVPSINYNKANPQIAFSESPFFVNKKLTPWVSNEYYAAVTALGIGGTNAHAILGGELSSENKKVLSVSKLQKFSGERYWVG